MIPVSVIIITKNEEKNIVKSLPILINNFDEIIIVDSNSTDKTPNIAKTKKVKFINFTWNNQYPKKRQWCLNNIKTKHDWIFMIDADEIITDDFVSELNSLNWNYDGYFIKSEMMWNGYHLKYGMKNNKLCLFKKSCFEYPTIDDLDIDGMGETEGHYQPISKILNSKIGQIKSSLIHHNSKNNWTERHKKYATWEIKMNNKDAWPIDPIFMREFIKDTIRKSYLRPFIIFIYSYVFKLGFLDGLAGLNYAVKRFCYTWNIVHEVQSTND